MLAKVRTGAEATFDASNILVQHLVFWSFINDKNHTIICVVILMQLDANKYIICVQ